MEDLMRLCAEPLLYFGSAFGVLGMLYLGIRLKDGMTGGSGELVKALAMIAAGGIIALFAACYK